MTRVSRFRWRIDCLWRRRAPSSPLSEHVRHVSRARPRSSGLTRMWACVALALLANGSRAEPIVPTHDDEVIETLPTVIGSRGEDRRARRLLAQQPMDAPLALSLAKRYLEQAHASGDPRYAGMAMAAIEAWRTDATAPEAVLLMRASIQQYLHQFDAAVTTLQQLLSRSRNQPQAWLTLATVRRVQGRYVESDRACEQLLRAHVTLFGNACLAENAALRGEIELARKAFSALLVSSATAAETQAWLATSVAELEQRAGRSAAADRAYRRAFRLAPDAYTALAYADFLLEHRRPALALAVLHDQARTDAVLLRLAIAGTQAGAPGAVGDVAEMRSRIALANERPDAKLYHGREQAMFALAIDHDARSALALAQGNVTQQREPLDLLVLAQAAHASGDANALQGARRLMDEVGLVDARINALL